MLAACFHRSPELAILAPFGEGDLYLFDDSTQANYVQFTDPTTASVFGDYVRSGRLRMAPKGSILLCPEIQTAGLHGYQLRVRVDQVMGDSAIASLSQVCKTQLFICDSCTMIGGPTTIIRNTYYLMLRTNRRWRLGKGLGGSIGSPG